MPVSENILLDRYMFKVNWLVNSYASIKYLIDIFVKILRRESFLDSVVVKLQITSLIMFLLFELVVSVTENRCADTRLNTNQNQGKIPKPNQPKNMREMPTFYRILSTLYIS